MSYEFLETLEQTIGERLADADTTSSYTAQLAAEGIVRAAQKVGEEGVELALAAATDVGRDELLGEAADLLYHVSVVLQLRGTSLQEVCDVLRARHRPTP